MQQSITNYLLANRFNSRIIKFIADHPTPKLINTYDDKKFIRICVRYGFYDLLEQFAFKNSLITHFKLIYNLMVHMNRPAANFLSRMNEKYGLDISQFSLMILIKCFIFDPKKKGQPVRTPRMTFLSYALKDKIQKDWIINKNLFLKAIEFRVRGLIKIIRPYLNIHFRNDLAIKSAVSFGSIKIVKTLVDLGAVLDTNSNLIIIAAHANKSRMLRFLFESGLDIRDQNFGQLKITAKIRINRLIDQCIRFRSFRTAEILIKRAIKSGILNDYHTILIVETNNLRLARVVLPYIQDQLMLDSLLITSIRCAYPKMIRLLHAKGADLNCCNKFPMNYAINNGNDRLVYLLVELGAQIDKLMVQKCIDLFPHSDLCLLLEKKRKLKPFEGLFNFFKRSR